MQVSTQMLQLQMAYFFNQTHHKTEKNSGLTGNVTEEVFSGKKIHTPKCVL